MIIILLDKERIKYVKFLKRVLKLYQKEEQVYLKRTGRCHKKGDLNGHHSNLEIFNRLHFKCVPIVCELIRLKI